MAFIKPGSTGNGLFLLCVGSMRKKDQDLKTMPGPFSEILFYGEQPFSIQIRKIQPFFLLEIF